ncbi:unnamed protein product [Prorocentrum cordatum]|uniref:RRM domain-containing protein n=1 Tax=Prorocentrum cordatum TaxID=2364126 RepID=A0ABN9XSJ3_9DINO|nr:unnamed protein product [Polarella glacialis]
MDPSTRYGSSQSIQRGMHNSTCNDGGLCGLSGLRTGTSQCDPMSASTVNIGDSLAFYNNADSHSSCPSSGGSYELLPRMCSLSTMHAVTMQGLSKVQSLPPWQESDNESWQTDDGFDHPCWAWRVDTDVGNPPENAQDSHWVGAGGAQSAAEVRLPSQPRRASLLHGVVEAAPARSPTRLPSTPLRFAAGAGVAVGPPGDWSRLAGPAHAEAEPGRAVRARQSASGGRRQSASGGRGSQPAEGAARAGSQQAGGGSHARGCQGAGRAVGLAPGAGAGLQQQAQEIRWRLSEQETDLVNLELYQRELAGRVPAPTEEVPTVTPAAPAITSLMIKNIPMVVTQGDLLDLVDQTGFANVYDYVYQPTDFDSRTTQGHAFVNFVTPRDAREFFIRWNGSRLTGVAGAGTIATAVLEVKASALQGYEENVRRWTASRMRRISNSEFHPFIARRLAAQ